MLDIEIYECGIVHTLSSSENLSGNSPNFSGGHSSDVLIILISKVSEKVSNNKTLRSCSSISVYNSRLYLINTEDLRGNINALFGSSQMFE